MPKRKENFNKNWKKDKELKEMDKAEVNANFKLCCGYQGESDRLEWIINEKHKHDTDNVFLEVKTYELKNKQQRRVWKLLSSGISQLQVSKKMKVNPSTISRIIDKIKETEKIKYIPKTAI